MKRILLVLLISFLVVGCQAQPEDLTPSALFEEGPLHIIGFFNLSSEKSEQVPKLIHHVQNKFKEDIKIESRRAWEERSSLVADEASECARNQGKLQPFLNEYFENNFEKFDKETMLAIAVKTELDVDIFETCLDSGLMKERIFRDKAFSRKYNVNTVPSFIVERNITISESLDEEAFQKTIQELLEILR
jgi:predicted DsbA family dithiol-disulfide isomerase